MNTNIYTVHESEKSQFQCHIDWAYRLTNLEQWFLTCGSTPLGDLSDTFTRVSSGICIMIHNIS